MKDQPQDGGARRQFEFLEVGREPMKDAPTLGRRPGGGRWSAATRAWFETYRVAPWAHLFEATDWNALRRCAVLYEEFWKTRAAATSGEIRQIEAKVGATLDDRMRLRIRVHRTVPAPAAETPADGERPALRVAPDPRRPLEVSA